MSQTLRVPALRHGEAGHTAEQLLEDMIPFTSLVAGSAGAGAEVRREEDRLTAQYGAGGAGARVGRSALPVDEMTC